MKTFRRGDTLIEVLIAFAVISLVMATAFNGAMSGYKSAQAAQNRTTAAFLAQYQAEALKAYRDSMGWASPDPISFLDGNKSGAGAILPEMKTITDFCMEIPISKDYWYVQTDIDKCNRLVNSLAPTLKNGQLKITRKSLTPASNPTEATYEIVVSWQPANSSVREESKTIVILTKN